MKYVKGIILFSFLIFVSCDKKKTMPELLKETANNQFFVPENIYASSVRATYFNSIAKVAPKNQRERYHLKKARELLYAGKTDGAFDI